MKMKAKEIERTIKEKMGASARLVEVRPGTFQVYWPIYHPDGDMLDVFIEQHNGGFRVQDHGCTLMHLSYEFSIDTENKERLYRQILDQMGVHEEGGNLFLDTDVERLIPAVMQMYQTIVRVSDLSVLRREVVKSLFWEEFKGFVETKLQVYRPEMEAYLPEDHRKAYPIDALIKGPRDLFLFAIGNNDHCKQAAIVLNHYERRKHPFRGIAVFQDQQLIGRKELAWLSDVVDKQFSSLEDNEQRIVEYVERELAA